MKKQIFTGLLFAVLSTTDVSGFLIAPNHLEAATNYTYRTYYITETVCGCKIKYRITIKYFACFEVCRTKCKISQDCSGSGEGGGNFNKKF